MMPACKAGLGAAKQGVPHHVDCLLLLSMMMMRQHDGEDCNTNN